MVVQILMTVGALTCTAAVANYIWHVKGCFKEVFNQIEEELWKD